MSDKACVLCNNSSDDALQFGEKSTYEDTTAHLYCMLLTSNLVQNGEDDEGISGFMPKDIKAEVSRTKKLLCHYCQGKSATIGCCVKSCRRSFHLPCGLDNDCRFEFTNTFRSFCDIHHDIKKPKNVHKPTDLCTVCYDEMGPYNPIRSIPLPCCNKNSWCHKLCLQKYAQSSGYFLKCPLCKDSDHFREFISERGVFIPDRDAKWEVEDTGPNLFYDFAQHSERPSECEAKVCKCKKGRRYQVDLEHHRHSLEFCDYCGSHAVHLGCMKGDKYLCEECAAIPIRTASATSSTTSGVNSNGTETERFISPNLRKLMSELNLREFSIRLTRLTAADLGFTLETGTDSEGESSESSESSASTSSSTITSSSPITSSTTITSSSTVTINITSSNDTQTDASSSDESKIMLCVGRKKKIISSESDSEEEIMPTKRVRLSSRNPFIDSDSDHKEPEFDLNENSKDVQCSNPTNTLLQQTKNTATNLALETSFKSISKSICAYQFSSSDDEQTKPTGTTVRNVLCSESSDEQVYGKENEKPSKNVAVVHPFSSRNEATSDSSSDSIIKPAKIQPRQRKMITSDEEDFIDFPETVPLPKQDHFVGKVESDQTSPSTDTSATLSGVRIKTKLSPSKRKHKSVLSYFRGTFASSDDEVFEQKPKRRSPKSKQRSPGNSGILPNQSTIMHFFKKNVN